MSESLMHLHFLSLILLCCVFPSRSFDLHIDNSTYVACGPHQTDQALTEFMNEFDSSRCNLTDPYNGVWCDNSDRCGHNATTQGLPQWKPQAQ